MIMLSQLNFDKLPELEGFPNTGIMQFFVNDYASNEAIGSNRVKVIYHKDILSKDEIMENVPRSTINNDLDSDTNYCPIKGVYYPSAKIDECGINPSNNEWFGKLVKYLNKEFNTNWSTWRDIPEDVDKAIWNNISKEYFGCRIGGHPYFSQNDLREGTKTEVMLLQLDSEAGMMWGDCGVANFFTSKNAIHNLDFDKKVMFTWDCC